MRQFLIALCLTCSMQGWAMTAAEYLPAGADLDPSVPTPESVLGWEIGDWRITHDQLVAYMHAVAKTSDRVSIKVIGRTHEQRPLLQLIFTTPANHARIEELREQHLRQARSESSASSPLVVWLGQSIHGNEASGSNAAPLIAYYLAASRSEFVTRLLEDSIILLDPSFNPDGLQRFSTWSNSNRSLNPVGDRNHRIHNEDWPQNRTNHYLFDLNRDWLPLVHPESRARVAEFHRWLPHVMTDQHEAYSALAYFFQPGVPERQNPLFPPETLAMHRKLGAYHAAAMDAAGELIFTEDRYDDFYIGKGSTYTDINGTIGILFEQARINGPVVKRPFGSVPFSDAIANQLRTTLSTLRGAHELRDDLARYQAGFFDTMSERAEGAGFAAWLLGDDGDPARARALLDVLSRHQIEFSVLDEDLVIDGRRFRAGRAWVLPVRQRQYALLQSAMERRTGFADETFYDVSAWTLPLAYNLPHARLKRLPAVHDDSPVPPSGSLPEAAVAWLIPWRQLDAPAVLQRLLEAGAFVQAATTPFTAVIRRGEQAFDEGTLQVHLAIQDQGKLNDIRRLLAEAAGNGIEIFSATSSLTPAGQDLGSRDFAFLKPVKPLLIAGPGTSVSEVGAIWHQLDQRLGFAPVMINMDQLGRVRLADYTHLLMTDAEHEEIGKSEQEQIVAWLKDGGILVTIGQSAAWAEGLCFEATPDACRDTSGEADLDKEEETPTPRPYADYDDDYVQSVIGGAIVGTSIDTTHPLGFGFARNNLALFRRGTTVLQASDNPYTTPVRYADEPLLSGFIGADRLDEIRGQPAVIAERHGEGLVVRFANDPVFRGFWRGTERLFVNALYFGQLVRSTPLPD
jgi:hypothetical protein